MRQAFAARRQAVFLVARHFAKSARLAVGQEHRIVAKALIAARRPDQGTVDLGLEVRDMTVGPRHAQRRDEMRLALFRCRCATFVQFDLDGLHGAAEILFRASPARRMDSRRAVERIDHQAGIIGKSGQAARKRCGLRLDPRVVAKAHAVLVRFWQIELTRRYGVDAVRRKQFAHLGELAGIMGGDNQTTDDGRRRTDFPMDSRRVAYLSSVICCPSSVVRHPTAIFCKSTSLAMPLRASASSAANSASENGVFSAVAWISTILPVPVRTKLASVSAWESSA